MIIIISGSPRSGKSTLSRELSKKLNTPYISTDALRLFMVANLKDDEEKYAYFPFEKMFDATTIDTFYADYSAAEILQADIDEAHNMMPGILAFIDYIKSTDTDYIIEGVHFLPEYMTNWKDDPGIQMIVLHKEDAEKIHLGLEDNKGNNDWIADNIEDDEILYTAAESLAEYGKYFRTEAEKHNIPHLSTEEDFFAAIDEALNRLAQ